MDEPLQRYQGNSMATAAERMKRHRDRKRRGVLAVVPVEVDIATLVTLIKTQCLDANDIEHGICNSSPALEKAVAQFLGETVRSVLADMRDQAA